MRMLRTDIRDAVDHLPEASVLALDGVTWEEYEQIGEELEERSGIRITYDRGRLEIVTTSPAHEKWKEFVLRLASGLCQEVGIHFESYGGMTQESRRHEKAVEADTCFYVANAERMIGREEIDINVDPPPDVVVEVDKAGQSRRKFSIYATFGVPEIWRVDIRCKRIEIFELRQGSYIEAPSSRFLPILTGDVLIRFIEQSRTEGQTPTLTAFRTWVRSEWKR